MVTQIMLGKTESHTWDMALERNGRSYLCKGMSFPIIFPLLVDELESLKRATTMVNFPKDSSVLVESFRTDVQDNFSAV